MNPSSWSVQCAGGGDATAAAFGVAKAGGGAGSDEIDDLRATVVDDFEHLGSLHRPLYHQMLPLVVFVNVPPQSLRGRRDPVVSIFLNASLLAFMALGRRGDGEPFARYGASERLAPWSIGPGAGHLNLPWCA